MGEASIEDRVARAAEAAQRGQGSVAAVDVVVVIGWLQPVHRDHRWQGRSPYPDRWRTG